MSTNSKKNDSTKYEALRLKAEKLPGDMYYRSAIAPPYGGHKKTFDAQRYLYGVSGPDFTRIYLMGWNMHDPDPTYDELVFEIRSTVKDGTHPVGPSSEVRASVSLNSNTNQFASEAKSGTITFQRNETERTITGTANLKVDMDRTTYEFKVEFHLTANAPLP
ncbi:hypothetical protein [Pseudomonas sp. KCJK9016]|uniref:hypothetical protein n=1 Tax=Pseudomonas sp. KCJK9016 TaxID=3344556 RepID=UPI0039062047